MKRDAQTYYKTLPHINKREYNIQKAKEAREALEKLGLPQINRISEREGKR